MFKILQVNGAKRQHSRSYMRHRHRNMMTIFRGFCQCTFCVANDFLLRWMFFRNLPFGTMPLWRMPNDTCLFLIASAWSVAFAMDVGVASRKCLNWQYFKMSVVKNADNRQSRRWVGKQKSQRTLLTIMHFMKVNVIHRDKRHEKGCSEGRKTAEMAIIFVRVSSINSSLGER